MNRSTSRLLPPLGRRAWHILAAQGLSDLGTGLTVPFLLIYLTRVRGMSLPVAGLILATRSAAGLLSVPVGQIIDRLGAARVAVVTAALSAAGSLGFAFVVQPWQAFGAAVVFSFGMSSTRAALFTMLAEVTPAPQRSAVFGANYAMSNLSVGIGGITGGFLVDLDHPGSFTAVFVADAVTWLIFAALLVMWGEVHRTSRRKADGEPSDASRSDTGRTEGYRTVLRDRALLLATGLFALLDIMGLSQLTSAFPAWATGQAGADAGVVGFAFAANTFLIVLLQFWVVHRMRGRRRTRAAAAAGLIFAAAWALILLAGQVHAGGLTAAGLIFGLALFGFGETLLSPSLSGIVNDLAPDELRGRYNSVLNLASDLGSIVGPALAGWFVGQRSGAFYLAGLMAGCMLAATGALVLERLLTPVTNRGHALPVAHDDDLP